ncbi:MAG: PaaI family thioesterase [Bacillota bacterium]|nr:PaaI family thioesterase [Bacillota bacterium]
MKRKVVKRLPNSKMCFSCGANNRAGLQAAFYVLEGKELAVLFTPREEHQGYPGILHGGIAGAILDEAIGRAILVDNDNVWGVTVELYTKYHKPVPLGEELRVLSRITKETKRTFEGTGEILLGSGEVAVSAYGKYVKLPYARITDSEEQNGERFIYTCGKELEEIDI